MKIFTREYHKNRFIELRARKREKEETNRWEQFLLDRATFDEALEETFDVYDQMMRSMEGRING